MIKLLIFIASGISLFQDGKAQSLSRTYSAKELNEIPTASPDYYVDGNSTEEESGEDSSDNEGEGKQILEGELYFITTSSSREVTTVGSGSVTEPPKVNPPKVKTFVEQVTEPPSTPSILTTTLPRVTQPSVRVTPGHKIQERSTLTEQTDSESVTPRLVAAEATETPIITTTHMPKEQMKEINDKRFNKILIPNFDRKLKTYKVVEPIKLPKPSQNQSYKIDFADYARNVKIVVDKFQKWLTSSTLVKHPVNPEFKEVIDLYYVILEPELTFTMAKQSCSLRKAELFEISTYLRFIQVQHLSTFSGTKIDDLNSDNWSVLIWLDTKTDEDDTLMYQSGQSLYFHHDEFGTLEAPEPPKKGNCIAFDILAASYATVPCDTELFTVCYIKKNADIIKQIQILDHLQERIDELARIKNVVDHYKNSNFLNSLAETMEDGVCPLPEMSLTKRLGLDEPTNALRVGSIDIDTYYDSYERFSSDVNQFKFLFKGNIEENLKKSLGINLDVTIVLHRSQSTICIYPEVKKVKIELLKVEVSTPRGEENVPSEIIETRETSAATNPATNAPASEESTFDPPSTSNETEIYLLDINFIKMTLYEVIIAGTSVTVTLIAVCNCVWVAVILVKRRRNRAIELTPSEVELTPMLQRRPKIKFGSSEIAEFSPYASHTTLPSPAPMRSRKN